ncbi:adenosylcobinamide-GDP ribazoletransferase [Aquamicrobium sp. LC103]|uniref:adenosylcobinamide-GDP ribazoletransferase n=1 Tax=Aquamicrobium sp. LC103 TaxID=1120658 RepID=UPI00063E85B1|nr:adenosylcobinamide-GDP ribazoletransferase [Aquamicrobium sp. LC103]TKT76689.1 adenosylcobinamide-GDP ribazoletransferase [Aquamicrobium sp. LC103]
MTAFAALVRDATACLAFYTRLPVPPAHAQARDFAAAQWASPVAGLAVAGIGGGVFWAAGIGGLPPALCAVATLAAILLATGCLHEDGLADVADGFGGGATRERKLEIMKDSRIGTYGVVALALALLARWSALAALADPGGVLCALVAAHGASRALFPAFMRHLPPARPTGLSAGIGAIPKPAATGALALGTTSLAALGLGPAILAAIALAAWFLLLAALARRQIGGRTGDVLGTLQQGAEIIVLFAACAFLAQP